MRDACRTEVNGVTNFKEYREHLRDEGELGVLFRDVDEDNYIGRLYTLPDEKSVLFGNFETDLENI